MYHLKAFLGRVFNANLPYLGTTEEYTLCLKMDFDSVGGVSREKISLPPVRREQR